MRQASVRLRCTPEGNWTHAAVQLNDGRWSSKLGVHEDISHRTPESLESELYGVVNCYMRRPR